MVEGGGRGVHLRFIVKVGTIRFTDGSGKDGEMGETEKFLAWAIV